MNALAGPLETHDELGRIQFELASRRQTMAEAIVLMEICRLKAAGQAVPTPWSQFRPEIARIGQAYSDWLELRKTDEGPKLIRYSLLRPQGRTSDLQLKFRSHPEQRSYMGARQRDSR